MSAENVIPKRPGMTLEMVRDAALVICKQQGWSDGAADDIASEYSRSMDGFDLCKALDQYHSWRTSREDMEALDELSYLVDAAIKKAETEWIEQYQITPPFPIGAVVVYRSGENLRGEIMGVSDYAPACYLVKPEGQDDEATGRRRMIIKFEEAKLAEAADA